MGTVAEMESCAALLRRAFGTVAREFGLTEKNAPSNAAFTTAENLRRHVEDGMMLYGMYRAGDLVGTVALKKSRNADGTYYIERLAVEPASRHRGYGTDLLWFAVERIRCLGGAAASVGLIDDNEQLKRWYRSKGFTQHDRRRVAHLPFKVCYMSLEVEARRPGGPLRERCG